VDGQQEEDRKTGDDVVRVISQLKTEIIERKWAEKKARDALDYAESIIDSVKHPLVVLDEQKKVISANLAFYDLFNLTPSVALGQNFLLMADGVFGFKAMEELLDGVPSKGPKTIEMDRTFQFIGRKFLRAAVQGLQYNVKHLHFSFLTIEDITEHKIAEARLRKALQDKSVLVREVHHRVKNNLQTLSSLLALQIATLENPEQKKVLEDGRARVMAMAVVHESLSANGSVERVTIVGPVKRLVLGIESIFDDGVHTDMDICEAALNIDQASLLCLVLNEIITNAHKHAFQDRVGGDNRISIEARMEDEILAIRVSDNGVGLGRGRNAADPETWGESLGFTLVRNLVEKQLRGEWKVREFGGVIHEVRFRVADDYELLGEPVEEAHV
jgi:two-component sensor histidine kinase